MTETETEGEAATLDRPERIEAAELPERIASGERLLVMFRTAGCSMCDAMEPVLDGVARSVDVPILVVNPRDHPPLVERHDIRSIPTLALFEDGEERGRLAEGFVPADDVIAFVAG